MNIEELHRQTVQWAKLVKAHAIAEYGVGEDVPVTLMAHGQEAVLLVQVEHDDGLSTGLSCALAATLRDCVIQLIFEAFTATVGSGSLEENLEALRNLYQAHDGLPGAFAAGDERVRESIILTSLAAEGLMYEELPYRYDGRRVEWLEDATETGGVVSYDDWHDNDRRFYVDAVRDAFDSDEPEEVTLARLMLPERVRMEGIAKRIRLLRPDDVRVAVITKDDLNYLRLEDE